MTTRPTWLRLLRGRPSGSAPAHPPRDSRRAPLRLEALEDRAVPAGFAFGIDGALATETAVDAAGNIYVAGGFTGTSDFDPGPGSAPLTSAGDQDLYVAKYTADGSFLWASRMGGPLQDSVPDLSLDDTGGILVAGGFQGTADFGATSLSATGGRNLYLTRLDPETGNFQWAVNVGRGDLVALGDVLADPSGIHLTGNFTGTCDFDPGAGVSNLTSLGTARDAYVMKLDPGTTPDVAPTFAWARRMGSGGYHQDWGYSLVGDGAGGVYVGGRFDVGPGTTAPADFGPFAVADWGGYVSGGYVTRLTGAGDFLWVKTLRGEIQGVTRDAAGNVYGTGMASGAIDLDPGPAVDLSPDGDHFVWTLDPAGNYRWGRVLGVGLGGGAATFTQGAVGVDGQGNVYAAGLLQGGDAEFDPGAGVVPVTEGGVDLLYLSKLDAAGNLASFRHFGGPGYDSVLGLTLVANPGGAAPDVLLSGFFAGSATFDTGVTSVELQTSSPTVRGGFVVRLSQDGGAVLGRVLHDLGGGEEGVVQDRTVYIDQNGNGQPDEMELSTTTGKHGQYAFYHLPAGTHTVRQVVPAGWSQSSPSAGGHTVILSEGQFAFGRDFRTTTATQTRTYSVTKAVNLRDNATTTSKVTVPTPYTVYDVNVRIDIAHPNVGDLVVSLIAPDGTRVYLTGGVGVNFTNTTFSDEAATAIAAGTAPFTGTFRPTWPLSGFDGKNASGAWTLEIQDTLQGNKGTLKSWSITLIGSL